MTRRRLATLLMIVLIAAAGLGIAGRRGARKKGDSEPAHVDLDQGLGPNHGVAITWDGLVYKSSHVAGGRLGAWISRRTSCFGCHN